MKSRLFPIVILLLSTNLLAADPAVRYVKAGDRTVAAIVPGSIALLHTGQVLSPDDHAVQLMTRVTTIVSEFGGDPTNLVKVNVAASTQEIADQARESLVRVKAPISFVVGALPHGQKLGIDVVAPAKREPPVQTSAARLLPVGPRVYVSGQAEKGANPAEAAANTIANLIKTLELFGSSKTDVIQAKCFLTPMSAAPEVMKEFEKVFGKQKLPLVFVEWKSDRPIEIELIAAAPPAPDDAPQIEYLTPPGVKPSPVFARVVRINRGTVIYTAGLYAEKPGTGEAQVVSIFDQLQRILKDAGGDLRHLAKATYYVSDGDGSKQLNLLRPKYYDPQRPPAASKAIVPGVGMKDRSIAIDMIGVVVESTPSTSS
jgi:enamine deaminase RidA (YjgF/YER057c/UK114 family)